MAKLLLFHQVLYLTILGFALMKCTATLYNVGDNSGWDISTDLGTWAQDKKFVVGDVLWFQYSSSHSVNEVNKENYDGCRTTDVLQSSSNGNTTYSLSKAGDRYFVCGNKLHCLGGMKLRVHVDEAAAAGSPAAAGPAGQAQPGAALPQPSSKTDNPSSVIPSSAMEITHGGLLASLAFAFLGFMPTVICMV